MNACFIVNLAIFLFDFKGGTLVLIASVPCQPLYFTFEFSVHTLVCLPDSQLLREIFLILTKGDLISMYYSSHAIACILSSTNPKLSFLVVTRRNFLPVSSRHFLFNTFMVSSCFRINSKIKKVLDFKEHFLALT